MDNKIKIHLPFSASFKTIEALLQQKLINTFIPPQGDKEEASPYAQILELNIKGVESEAYNLILNLKIKILRTVLKRNPVDLLCYVALDYDNEKQELFISNFKIKSMTSSRLYNASMETLANRVVYHKIINNSRLDILNLLEKEKKKVNKIISEGFKMKGINIIGEIDAVRIQDVRLLQNQLVLQFQLEGNAEAEFYDLIDLIQ